MSLRCERVCLFGGRGKLTIRNTASELVLVTDLGVAAHKPRVKGKRINTPASTFYFSFTHHSSFKERGKMEYITYEIKTKHAFRKTHHLQSSSSSSSSLSTSNFSTSKEEMEKNRMSVSCLCRDPTAIATAVHCQLNNCADEPQVMAPGNGPRSGRIAEDAVDQDHNLMKRRG